MCKKNSNDRLRHKNLNKIFKYCENTFTSFQKLDLALEKYERVLENSWDFSKHSNEWLNAF